MQHSDFGIKTIGEISIQVEGLSITELFGVETVFEGVEVVRLGAAFSGRHTYLRFITKEIELAIDKN